MQSYANILLVHETGSETDAALQFVPDKDIGSTGDTGEGETGEAPTGVRVDPLAFGDGR